jgi:hypothetical protein
VDGERPNLAGKSKNFESVVKLMRKKKDEPKKDDLKEIVDSLCTLDEASQWIEQHKEEYNLTEGLTTDTLKKACYQGRLKAVLKGRLYLTREQELREYLEKFDPKNKRERQPIKERTKQRRQAKAKTQQAPQEVIVSNETPTEPEPELISSASGQQTDL